MAGEMHITPALSDALTILGAAGVVIPTFARFRINPVERAFRAIDNHEGLSIWRGSNTICIKNTRAELILPTEGNCL